MKIAVSGKGGTGKSTVTAALALILAEQGSRVLAVDADPDGNLASALGISEEEQKKIVTIAKQKELIEERTGAKVSQYGQIFKLNPDVSDIADVYAYNLGRISLLVLGAIGKGGGGCACPESSLLRALVQDLVLYRNDILLMDMEAGIEHLGRSTAMGIDVLLVVAEPGQRAIDSARRIARLAGEIGIADIRLVINKIRSAEEELFVRNSLPGFSVIGAIPFNEELLRSDRDGVSVMEGLDDRARSIFAGILGDLRK